MRARELRYATAETVLLAGLVLLSVLSVPDVISADGRPGFSWPEQVARYVPEQGFSEILPAVSLCLVLYWLLHLLGRAHISFWLMVLIVLLPQSAAIFSHNQIGWHQFFVFELGVVDDRSLLRDTGLFLFSLVGLVGLNRVIGLRQVDRRMHLQGIDRAERYDAARFELSLLIGLVAAALLLAFVMMGLSALLGRLGGTLGGSSWTVVIVGGGATLLLAFSLVLWYRGRQG